MGYLISNVLGLARRIYADIGDPVIDAEFVELASAEELIDSSLVKGTRGYIEWTFREINVTYREKCYTSCAAMLRRLLETLIFEVYDADRHVSSLRRPNDASKFLNLGDLVSRTHQDYKDDLTEKAKDVMPKIRDLGNVFVHNRRVYARESDIARLQFDIRIMVEEMLALAKLI